MLRITDDELFESHIKAWKRFWSNFQITVDGDDELVKNFQKFCGQKKFFGISFAVSYDNFKRFLSDVKFADA